MALKGDFIFRDHTDLVPGPQKTLGLGDMRVNECQLVLVARMCRRDQHTGSMLEYLDGQALGENLGRCVQVEERCVALPPTHQVDGVGVHPCHKQG